MGMTCAAVTSDMTTSQYKVRFTSSQHLCLFLPVHRVMVRFIWQTEGRQLCCQAATVVKAVAVWALKAFDDALLTKRGSLMGCQIKHTERISTVCVTSPIPPPSERRGCTLPSDWYLHPLFCFLQHATSQNITCVAGQELLY
eukprot:1079573-Pelagomonas_calceolata.AAC.2